MKPSILRLAFSLSLLAGASTAAAAGISPGAKLSQRAERLLSSLVDAGYLGLTPREAGDLAEERGHPWRIVTEQGVIYPVNLTVDPERLNFAVEKGRVTRVARG